MFCPVRPTCGMYTARSMKFKWTHHRMNRCCIIHQTRMCVKLRLTQINLCQQWMRFNILFNSQRCLNDLLNKEITNRKYAFKKTQKWHLNALICIICINTYAVVRQSESKERKKETRFSWTWINYCFHNCRQQDIGKMEKADLSSGPSCAHVRPAISIFRPLTSQPMEGKTF